MGSNITIVHCKRAPYDIYIGRPSFWGNPYELHGHCPASRAAVLAKYEAYVRERPRMLAQLHTLRGKVLGCWCAPHPCHGDVLRKLLEEFYPD